MIFRNGSRRVILKGDLTLTKVEVSLKRLSRNWEASDQGFWVEFRALTSAYRAIEEPNSTPPSVLPPEVERLLIEYRSVVHDPTGLPP